MAPAGLPKDSTELKCADVAQEGLPTVSKNQEAAEETSSPQEEPQEENPTCPRNRVDDIAIGSLLMLLWRSSRGTAVGGFALDKLRELHQVLVEGEYMTGDFPTTSEAEQAAQCFLRSDSYAAEIIKRKIWNDERDAADDDDDDDLDDLDYLDDLVYDNDHYLDDDDHYSHWDWTMYMPYFSLYALCVY